MTAPTKLPDHPHTQDERARYPNIKRYITATVDPGSLTTYTATTGTVACTGAALGDPVIVAFSADIQAQQLTAYVNDGDSITWVLFNSTGGTIDLASGTMYFTVLSKNQGQSDGL